MKRTNLERRPTDPYYVPPMLPSVWDHVLVWGTLALIAGVCIVTVFTKAPQCTFC